MLLPELENFDYSDYPFLPAQKLITTTPVCFPVDYPLAFINALDVCFCELPCAKSAG